MGARWKREAHLVTGLLLLVSFGVAMDDVVLKLRRIVPAQQSQESSTPTPVINAKTHFKYILVKGCNQGRNLTIQRMTEA